jgi:hypothetical protein
VTVWVARTEEDGDGEGAGVYLQQVKCYASHRSRETPKSVVVYYESVSLFAAEYKKKGDFKFFFFRVVKTQQPAHVSLNCANHILIQFGFAISFVIRFLHTEASVKTRGRVRLQNRKIEWYGCRGRARKRRLKQGSGIARHKM